jgi:hypothetical protein
LRAVGLIASLQLNLVPCQRLVGMVWALYQVSVLPDISAKSDQPIAEHNVGQMHNQISGAYIKADAKGQKLFIKSYEKAINNLTIP